MTAQRPRTLGPQGVQLMIHLVSGQRRVERGWQRTTASYCSYDGGRNAGEDLRIHDAYLRIVHERPSAPVRAGRVAHVHIARCAAIFRQGHHRKTQHAVDEALDALRSELKEMPRAHQRLMVLKARALVAESRLPAALAIYDEVLERFRRGTSS